MGKFIIGFILGGATVLGALRYHVVRAEDGLHMVPKMSATLSESYVDIRGYGVKEWGEHPAVAAALIRDGKGNLMGGAAAGSMFSGAEGFLKSLNR